MNHYEIINADGIVIDAGDTELPASSAAANDLVRNLGLTDEVTEILSETEHKTNEPVFTVYGNNINGDSFEYTVYIN